MSKKNSKPKFIFYVDVDGILTPCIKLFHCVENFTKWDPVDEKLKALPDERWYKSYSDRDSWVLLRMKDNVVFISHDKRNEHYVRYKNHKWCYAAHSTGDKYRALLEDWKLRAEAGEVEGDPNKPFYLYVGDAPFDYYCLKNAKIGFIPLDCDPLLLAKLRTKGLLSMEKTKIGSVTLLKSAGGQGCISEAMLRVHSSGLYLHEPELKGAKIFDEIEKYLGME